MCAETVFGAQVSIARVVGLSGRTCPALKTVAHLRCFLFRCETCLAPTKYLLQRHPDSRILAAAFFWQQNACWGVIQATDFRGVERQLNPNSRAPKARHKFQSGGDTAFRTASARVENTGESFGCFLVRCELLLAPTKFGLLSRSFHWKSVGARHVSRMNRLAPARARHTLGDRGAGRQAPGAPPGKICVASFGCFL